MNKKFINIKEGEKLFILMDRNFQLDRGDSIGFANPNYGITILSRYVTRIYKGYPRRGDSVLLDITLSSDIMYDETNGYHEEFEKDKIAFGESLFISKDEGEETSVTRIWSNYGGYYRNMPNVHIFTTKEELKEWVENKTRTITDNLNRLNRDIRCI